MRLPYFLEHAFVAVSIQLAIYASTGNALAGLAAGIAFYAGREIRDYQKIGHMDWMGIIAPVVACLIVWGLL